MFAQVLDLQQVLGERLKLTDRESWDSKDGMTELKQASCTFYKFLPIEKLEFFRYRKAG
jgi:hypothetical protein